MAADGVVGRIEEVQEPRAAIEVGGVGEMGEMGTDAG